MRSKTIPYGRQSVSSGDVKAVSSVLRRPLITQGLLVEAFEAALARFCGARFAVAFSSGTAALHAACFAAGLGPGDEIVTSAVSFAASANCALYLGARPKLADIDPATAQVTAETLAQCAGRRTRAIIPVDFAGRPCDILPIRRLAERLGAVVIADACHSLGASYRTGHRWSRVGDGIYAHMTCFSFHPVKTITTGEGGAVTTNDSRLAEQLRRFRHHGMTKAVGRPRGGAKTNPDWYYEMVALGMNYRLTDFQCALGISQLKRIASFLAARRRIVARYRKELAGTVKFLSGDDDTHRSANHILPVLVPPRERDRIFTGLRKAGIGVQVHYIPIYRHPYYRARFGLNPRDYPHAEDYYARTLTLPVFPELKDREQDRVIREVKRPGN